MGKKREGCAAEWLPMMRFYDGIILMGHHLADHDAVGCMAGMVALASESHVPVSIAPGLIAKDMQPVFRRFVADGVPVISEPPENIARCVIIVGDTQQPAFAAYPEWLPLAGGIAVIDHHIPGTKSFDNMVLSWIDTEASSTSELVACLLFDAGVSPTFTQADLMLAGIMLDTRHFTRQVTENTFQQGANLCAWGAKVEHARAYFEVPIESYITRSQVVHDAIFENGMAFSAISIEIENAYVIAAQAANDLISLRGINAAFVASMEGGVVSVSIRAREGLSAMRWAAAFGGGGTNAAAGFQVSGITPEQAIECVRMAANAWKVCRDDRDRG